MMELYILFVIVGVVVHEAFHAIALLTVGINHENINQHICPGFFN